MSGLFGGGSSNSGPPPAACPAASVLKPLAQTATFAPGAPHQPLNVAFYGILSDVTAKCDRNGDAMRISLDVVVFGERGPSANKGEGVDLQYFVAVTGPDQSILSKRSFPLHISIPQDAKRSGVTDHVEDTFSIGGRAAPGDLRVVVGLQQSPEAVDFYKHFRGR